MWEGWGDESCSTQQPQTLNTRDTRIVRIVAYITSVLVILSTHAKIMADMVIEEDAMFDHQLHDHVT